MKLTKTEKRMYAVLLAVSVILVAVSNVCENCKMGNNFFAAYCNYCSEPLRVAGKPESEFIPPEEAIIGQWKTMFEYYYEYTFYADGTCEGYYYGGNPDYQPCLYPELCNFGSGHGTWSFEDGYLKVVYSGEEENFTAGTHYYSYEFDDNYTTLIIHDPERDAVWLKVPEEQ